MRGRPAGIIAVVLLSLLVGPGAEGSAARNTRALFFGDSLFAGNGARPFRPVQVQTANSLLGWQAELDTFGGTGYTTGGPQGRPYGERLQRDGFLRTPYDVIVIEGGTNDAHHGSIADLKERALEVVDYVRQRQPRARLVLVGGFAPAGQPSARYTAADAILATVAEQRGIVYISQLSYGAKVGRGFYSRDHLHPTATGYQQMGRDLARSLRAAVG